MEKGPLLLALLAAISSECQAARRSARDAGEYLDNGHTSPKDDDGLVECIYKNFYRPPGATEDHNITIVKGIPEKNCRMTCNKLRFSNIQSSNSVSNVGILALEQGCLDQIEDEENLRKDGQCTCKTKDGQQLVPTYGAVSSCTKENCWKFHKQIFEVDRKANAWMMAGDMSCQPCAKGSCDRVILGDEASDVQIQALMAIDSAQLTDAQKKVKSHFQRFYQDHSDKSVARRVGSPKLEWRMPENARCSKPCDDGSEETPYIVDNYVCRKDGKAVNDEECIKARQPRPGRQECPFLLSCRAAWSTEPLESLGRKSSGKKAPESGALPLDGPWTQRGSKHWTGPMISDTTPTLAALTLHANTAPGADLSLPGNAKYVIRIAPGEAGPALSYVDENGHTNGGSYNQAEDTLTWNTHEGQKVVWVRRDGDSPEEETFPPIVGAWVSEGSGEYRGTFDFSEAADERMFTALTLDGTPSTAKAKIVGKAVVLYGEDGTNLEEKVILKGALKWDPNTGVDTLTWASTEHTPAWVKPSAWVRLGEPTMSEGSYGKCSQTCLPPGEEVTGTQAREVDCLVETGGLFSGKWKARPTKVCSDLIDSDKPREDRKCEPSPPLCGNWDVVCESKSGEIMSDEGCAGPKPKIPS